MGSFTRHVKLLGGGDHLICYEALWKKKRERGAYIEPLRNAREFSGQSSSAMNKCFFRLYEGAL